MHDEPGNKSRHRWGVNIKVELTELGCENVNLTEFN
jgi:hypothetical protein